jgi:hypothetical protein
MISINNPFIYSILQIIALGESYEIAVSLNTFPIKLTDPWRTSWELCRCWYLEINAISETVSIITDRNIGPSWLLAKVVCIRSYENDSLEWERITTEFQVLSLWLNRHLHMLYIKQSLDQTGQPNYHSIVSECLNKKEDVEALFVSRTLTVITCFHRLLDGWHFLITFCIGTAHKNLGFMSSIKF